METNMTDITDFIQAAVADKPIAAQQAFAAAMSDRVDDALTAKYDEVQQQVFNGVDEVEDDTDELEAYEFGVLEAELENQEDLETEMEDNDV